MFQNLNHKTIFKPKGSPTPRMWYNKAYSASPRQSQNNLNNDRNKLRNHYFRKTQTTDKTNQQIMTTLRPKLQAIIQKYESTTIDPIELIKKYQNSLKSITSRKYPTKYVESGQKTYNEGTTPMRKQVNV